MRQEIYLTPKEHTYRQYPSHFTKGKKYKATFSRTIDGNVLLYKYYTDRGTASSHIVGNTYRGTDLSHMVGNTESTNWMEEVVFQNTIGGKVL